jgi:light-harvesting complex I chlorophyll a/b binding protein 1
MNSARMESSLSTSLAAGRPFVFFQSSIAPLAFAFTDVARARHQLKQPSSCFPLVEKNEARFIRQQTAGRRRRRQWTNRPRNIFFSSEIDDESAYFEDYEESDDEVVLGGNNDLSKLDSLEDLLMDLENDLETLLDDGDDVELDEADFDEDADVEALLALLGGEDDEDFDDDYEYDEAYDDDDEGKEENRISLLATNLEQALMQGVVPVSAGVGSNALPGDRGFDPLHFAEKDYIMRAQYTLLQLLPGTVKEDPPPPRPSALILRDYREAEIRHGRLAMLAAIIWPLQEMLDKLLLDVDQFGPLIYGPMTLPYFPLLMTLIMMLLGYLDIYAKAIQEKDDIGDAFLPGDCFWDPLFILEGAPASMKRNMQERELFNGRVAMLAFAAYTFEEATTHLPVISVEGNELLFLPAYQVPYIQEYLDQQFSFYS